MGRGALLQTPGKCVEVLVFDVSSARGFPAIADAVQLANLHAWSAKPLHPEKSIVTA
jgi:hypothetical protein